jgi:hypothetical protein
MAWRVTMRDTAGYAPIDKRSHAQFCFSFCLCKYRICCEFPSGFEFLILEMFLMFKVGLK